MENKKTIVGIIIVLILIIGLVVVSYQYNIYNTEQIKLLTDETNTLLKTDIIKEEINSDVKTEKNFAIVEKTIKEYLLKLKNIYSNINELYNQINPNDIFSAQNIEDQSFEEIDKIIEDYRQKGKDILAEYKELIQEENISNSIKEKKITFRKDYFVNLYNTAMLSEAMKEKYNLIQREIEDKKDQLSYKLNKLEKIEEYLKDNTKYWVIKNDKIQFTNINKMTDYYNLLNQVED